MWGPLNNEHKTLAKKFITSPTDFVNSKLTAKLMRQLQDLLTLCSGAMPDWAKKLPLNSPFLFPFDTRKLYFNCTSFGIARALQALQQHLQGSNSARNTEIRIGRIQRQKVRISRERLLDSALKVMELYGKSKAILEVEYFGEVGTGLGPTLEFYTLVSQELQRKDLKMWRDDKPIKKSEAMEVEGKMSEDEQIARKYVHTAGGLFPAPLRY
jgi:E3 ubiquitin-protein ligase TRIP12